MKRKRSVLLAALLVLFCLVPVSAAEPTDAPGVNEVYLGDLGTDGVDATDARYILQVAAGLRTADANQANLLDIDRQNGVTAVDARWALQIAAGLRGARIYNTVTGEIRDLEIVRPVTAAEVAAAINSATASAVNGGAGYTWTRESHFTEPIDLGSATETLNNIIQAVDPNASIDSVVGGFVGIGENRLAVGKGQDAASAIGYHGENYRLKATALRAEDIQNLQVNGNTYTFKLPDVRSPKKDGATALSRLTDDILTQEEVSAEIQDQVGSALRVSSLDILYSDIQVTAVIEDGTLQELRYSFNVKVEEIGLTAAIIPITGTGAMATSASYTDFVY